MSKSLLSLIIVCFSLYSCECTYQYGVNVINNTTQSIRVDYKSSNDERGEIEESIILNAGETKQIIYTNDFNTGDGCNGCKQEHCNQVAEYVYAYSLDSIKSNITWCDKLIQFDKTDIQQAEFTITYNPEDFTN